MRADPSPETQSDRRTNHTNSEATTSSRSKSHHKPDALPSHGEIQTLSQAQSEILQNQW